MFPTVSCSNWPPLYLFPRPKEKRQILLQCLHQSICFVSANDAALSRQARKLFSFTYLAAPYVLFGTPPVSVWLSDSRKKEVNTMLNPIMSSSWILMPTIHWWTSDSDMTCRHVCPSPSGLILVSWWLHEQTVADLALLSRKSCTRSTQIIGFLC
jgi:hypothetical protein